MTVRADAGSRLRVAAGCLVGLLGVLAAWGQAAPAPAEPRVPPVIAVPANAAGECLGSGQVWLVVVTDTGATLANRCVGRPANGMAALQAAGLATTFAPGGYICTLGGYPSRCPTTYDGRFWHYYHSTTGTGWTFANTGPAGYRYPTSGMIDGWCYNAAGAKDCTPPTISVVAPPSQEPPTTAPSPRLTTSKPRSPESPGRGASTPSPVTTGAATTTPPRRATSAPTAAPSSASRPPTGLDPSTEVTATGSATSSPTLPSAVPSSPVTSSPSTSSLGTSSPGTSSPGPSASSLSPDVTATAPGAGGPWGVIGTGAVLVTGALAWVGWRRIHRA